MTDLSGISNLLPKFDEARRPGDGGASGLGKGLGALGRDGLGIENGGIENEGLEGSASQGVASFGQMLGDGIRSVSARQAEAREEMKKIATGESNNVHDAMFAMGKSEVAFTLMLEVRNRLVDAWREITRIQV